MRASHSDYNTIIIEDNDCTTKLTKKKTTGIQFNSSAPYTKTHTYVLYSIMNHSIHLNFRILYNAQLPSYKFTHIAYLHTYRINI